MCHFLEQELIILPEHLSSAILSRVHNIQLLVFCVVVWTIIVFPCLLLAIALAVLYRVMVNDYPFWYRRAFIVKGIVCRNNNILVKEIRQVFCNIWDINDSFF